MNTGKLYVKGQGKITGIARGPGRMSHVAQTYALKAIEDIKLEPGQVGYVRTGVRLFVPQEFKLTVQLIPPMLGERNIVMVQAPMIIRHGDHQEPIEFYVQNFWTAGKDADGIGPRNGEIYAGEVVAVVDMWDSVGIASHLVEEFPIGAL